MKSWCLRYCWLVAFVAGVCLFLLGVSILGQNPYWRSETGDPRIDNRVYLWNGIAHLVSAIGLLSVSLGALLGLARAFKTKWLYWTAVLAGTIIWFIAFGLQHSYSARYRWDSRIGVIELTMERHPSCKPWNRLWESVVRWQVEPELRMWLAGSPLRRTHGWVSIRVVRIVPIANVTLDCDCVGCCSEEDSASERSR